MRRCRNGDIQASSQLIANRQEPFFSPQQICSKRIIRRLDDNRIPRVSKGSIATASIALHAEGLYNRLILVHAEQHILDVFPAVHGSRKHKANSLGIAYGFYSMERFRNTLKMRSIDMSRIATIDNFTVQGYHAIVIIAIRVFKRCKHRLKMTHIRRNPRRNSCQRFQFKIKPFTCRGGIAFGLVSHLLFDIVIKQVRKLDTQQNSN